MSSNEITMNDIEIPIDTISAKDRELLEKAQPMWKMIFNQFIEHKLAVVGSIIILIFSLISIFAGTIERVTDLDPDAQNVAHRYLAPMTVAQAGQDVRETAVERFINAHPEAADKIQKALIAKGVVSVAEIDALYELTARDAKEAIASLKSLDLPEASDLISTF